MECAFAARKACGLTQEIVFVPEEVDIRAATR
jgi:hypothetical protein